MKKYKERIKEISIIIEEGMNNLRILETIKNIINNNHSNNKDKVLNIKKKYYIKD